MKSRDVDALWQEMSMENEYQADKVSRLLKRSMATAAPSKKASLAKTSVNRVASYANIVTSSKSLVKYDENFSLPKVLNRLAAEQCGVRKKAAIALEMRYLRDNGEGLDAELFGEMAKPLFRRFNDPVEKVREICIRITTKFIAKEEDLLRYLPYLMPAITNRINSQYGYDEENQVFSRDRFLHEAFKRGRVYVAENQVARIKPDEPSEEIRLLLLSLTNAVLQNAFERRASSILHAYIFDILLALISGARDDFHEINILSCRILAAISNHMVSVMKHFSVAMVRTLMPLLLHRLARVRVAVIETISALVTCPNVEKCKGSGTEAIVDLIGHRDENVIPVASFYLAEVRLNYFAKLDQDQNPTVRRAFFAMVSDWMVNLPDRYDHESRLLPYLLSAVSDEDVTISGDAVKTLEILGERYEREHAEEVLEMKQYGMDGKNPAFNYRSPLPAPFTAGRPPLGTRLFVRGRARRFLGPILRELANWQDFTRAHAVRLLKCVLVYCEETITVDVHLLVITLLKTWDADSELLEELQHCANLTGRFAAPSTYLRLLLSRVRGDSNVVVATAKGYSITTSQTEVGLEVLRCLMGGSLDKMVLPHIPEILDTIGLPSILNMESQGVKVALSRILLQITEVLERSGNDAVTACFLERGHLTSMEQSYSRLFDIGVVLVASSYCPAATTEYVLLLKRVKLQPTISLHVLVLSRASSALKRLATLESLPGIDQLYAKHSASLLNRALQDLHNILAVQWLPHCATQLAMEQILAFAPVALLLNYGAELTNLFCTILQHEQTSQPNGLSGKESIAEAEKNVAKTLRARKQTFKRVLQWLVERVEAELEQQSDNSASLGGTSYVAHWKSLLSATKVAAASP